MGLGNACARLLAAQPATPAASKACTARQAAHHVAAARGVERARAKVRLGQRQRVAQQVWGLHHAGEVPRSHSDRAGAGAAGGPPGAAVSGGLHEQRLRQGTMAGAATLES